MKLDPDSLSGVPHHKTKVIILTRKWAYHQPEVLFGGHRIKLKQAVRYLGVALESKLTFTRHISWSPLLP